jgi:hypothetical protein
MATTAKRPATFIDPERLYALRGFQEAAGIAATRMREARLQGLTPTTLRVGKRVFIRGKDAIEYIEALAHLSAPQPR